MNKFQIIGFAATIICSAIAFYSGSVVAIYITGMALGLNFSGVLMSRLP